MSLPVAWMRRGNDERGGAAEDGHGEVVGDAHGAVAAGRGEQCRQRRGEIGHVERHRERDQGQAGERGPDVPDADQQERRGGQDHRADGTDPQHGAAADPVRELAGQRDAQAMTTRTGMVSSVPWTSS